MISRRGAERAEKTEHNGAPGGAARQGHRRCVHVDAKSDRYAKRDEAMLTIGNRMLAQLAAKGRLAAVTKATSHETPGI